MELLQHTGKAANVGIYRPGGEKCPAYFTLNNLVQGFTGSDIMRDSSNAEFYLRKLGLQMDEVSKFRGMTGQAVVPATEGNAKIIYELYSNKQVKFNKDAVDLVGHLLPDYAGSLEAAAEATYHPEGMAAFKGSGLPGGSTYKFEKSGMPGVVKYGLPAAAVALLIGYYADKELNQRKVYNWLFSIESATPSIIDLPPERGAVPDSLDEFGIDRPAPPADSSETVIGPGSSIAPKPPKKKIPNDLHF